MTGATPGANHDEMTRRLAYRSGVLDAYPDVESETQILIGKPFQCILQWIEEVQPSLLVIARHGSHRIDGTELGSQAENLLRLASCLLVLNADSFPRRRPQPGRDTPPGSRPRVRG